MNIAEKYQQPEVVNFWKTFSQTGLQACEEEMMRRYAPSPARVLDLGCGGGRAGLALTPLGYEVTGLDLIYEMLIAARELNHPERLAQADLCFIPFADSSYDVAVIFIAAFQHIPTRLARRGALTEVARTLQPGGVLIVALDNLAPALTCYIWWAWRKVFKSKAVAAPHITSADSQLESNRSRTSALLWHLAGLARTLRWRTWNGVVDVIRRSNLLRGEVGDTEIDQVSLRATRGRVYYHLYQHDELIADARAAGFELIHYHSGRELTEDQEFAPRVRQLDKQVLYAFRKKD